MLSLRAFTLNLYRPPAPPVRSAVCLKTRDSSLRHRALEQLLIITGALAGSCGAILGSIMRKGGGGMLLATIASRANRIVCGRIASSGGSFRIPLPFRCQFPCRRFDRWP